ncbi:asparagine synthetase [glutamine-hydrolyzing] 2, partial [Quercus suber]
LRHRGPDWSGLHCHGNCYLAHQRLAIVDPTSGDQPLYNEDKTVVVTVNGEIYNHKQLREKLKSHQFRTGSDCEVIAHLYEEYGEDFVDMLDGMFSFVLLDTRDNSFIAARDAIGITPLYIGWGLDAASLSLPHPHLRPHISLSLTLVSPPPPQAPPLDTAAALPSLISSSAASPVPPIELDRYGLLQK